MDAATTGESQGKGMIWTGRILTGVGGAVATHVRIGSPLFTHTFFGIYVGLIAWAALWLRDPRLRALLR